MKIILSISMEVNNETKAQQVADAVKEVIKNENNVSFNARTVNPLDNDMGIITPSEHPDDD